MTGKIRTLRVDKGFGFIRDTAGNDYFFHGSVVFGEGIDNIGVASAATQIAFLIFTPVLACSSRARACPGAASAW